jgi:site-specific DNA recombinase
VIIQESKIEIMLSRKELRRLLDNGGKILRDNLLGRRTPIDPNDLISLTIEARRKRCGGEVHLVVPPQYSVSPGTPKPPLIKAVARAHGWYEKVIQGDALDIRSLAGQAGLTERYVGKVFACAFLAPDIIEAVLEGRQPRDLTFAKLSQYIPLSWSEQRKQFGFPEIPSQTSQNNSL